MTGHAGNIKARFSARATADSHFSWLRTRLSLESTLLSWVRTSASLIGFGFTIVQFFDRFKSLPGVKQPLMPNTPRDLGLALIFAGVVSLGLSTWQYKALNRYLSSGEFAVLAGVDHVPARSATPIVAVLLLVIGFFAFFAVLFRLS